MKGVHGNENSHENGTLPREFHGNGSSFWANGNGNNDTEMRMAYCICVKARIINS